MTLKEKQKSSAYYVIKSFLIFGLFFYFAIFVSDDIAVAALDGFKLAINVIIPTAFPFMIFSDYASHCFEFEKSSLISSAFEKLFKINRIGICAFFSGIAGGFPIGAKCALNLYNDGKISKCECERLMCFSGIASPAYVISAVGVSILKSFKAGLLLYLTLVFSGILCGYLIGSKKTFYKNKVFNKKQNFNIVASIKSSSAGSLYIIFFISFFSALSALIKKFITHKVIYALIFPFLEVSNAVIFFSDFCIFPFKINLAIIAFSLSFSGLSVIMQSLSFAGGEDISIKKCIAYKLLQGTISFIIILLLPISAT